MKNTSKIAFISLVVTGIMGFSATHVQAETTGSQSQNLDQEMAVTCTSTGSYGQNTTCEINADQSASQEQTIVLRDGTVLGVHQPVDAGLDPRLAMGLIGLTIASGAGYVVTKKS